MSSDTHYECSSRHPRPSSVPIMSYFNPPSLPLSHCTGYVPHLLLSRCITCTVRGTWNSADYHATSCFIVWSHGPCILWLLKLVPQQAARALHLSMSPQQRLHLLPSPLPGLSSSAQTVCHWPGGLPPSPMGRLESISYLGEVWRKLGGEEVMKRLLKGER